MKKVLFFAVLFLVQTLANGQYFRNYALVSEIYVTGNKKTANFVILRELVFQKGDIIDFDKIDKLIEHSRENIVNLSIFNFVDVTYTIRNEASSRGLYEIDINISVEERWYYWPRGYVRFEDDFNSWIKNPELDRVTYVVGGKIYNFMGYNQSFTALYTFGFQNGFRVEYGNIALDRRGHHSISLSAIGSYTKIENVMSQDDKIFYLRSEDDYLVRKESYLFSYTYRPQLRIRSTFSLEFENKRISQKILDKNPLYWGGSNLKRTGFYMRYNFISDQRDNVQYPQKGYYINMGISGYTDTGEDITYGKVTGDLRIYGTISERWSFASRFYVGASATNCEAYIFDRAIGYNSVVLRGFEYYVADGQHYITLNPTIRYNILPTRVLYLNFLKTLPKFNKMHIALYLKAYFDMGYTHHNNPLPMNSLTNRLLYSYGVGIDLVSYYDITASLDYSFNPFFKKGGLFVSFKSPIK